METTLAPRLRAAQVLGVTLLLSTVKYQCFYLYLVLDLFSRFIVGWLIAEKQSGDYAEQLLAARFKHFQLAPDQLTVHSDNGGPMTAKPLACAARLVADVMSDPVPAEHRCEKT